MVNDTVKAMGLGAETQGHVGRECGGRRSGMDGRGDRVRSASRASGLKNGDADGADPTKPDFGNLNLEMRCASRTCRVCSPLRRAT